jgi:hypothetical protein
MWTATIEGVSNNIQARGIDVVVVFTEGETSLRETLTFSGPDWRKDLEGAIRNRLTELNAMASASDDAAKELVGKVYSLDQSGEAKPNV